MPTTSPSDPVTVLDGGLSTALEGLGADLGSALWTARLLSEDPGLLVAAHRAYFDAGAQVATRPATRPASQPRGGGVRRGGGGPADHVERRPRPPGPRRGVRRRRPWSPRGRLRRAVRRGAGRRLGVPRPLRALRVGAARLPRPRLELLASTGPDLFAVETIPDVDEARVLVELLDEVGIPAWFTYSVREGRTCADQSLTEAYDALAGSSAIVAAGVNCSHPDEVLGAVEAGVAATGLPAVAYPNKGGSWDSATRTWEGASGLDAASVSAWVEAGARYVGGCCGTGPADIEALSRAVSA